MPCRRSQPLDGQFSKDWVNVIDDDDSWVSLGIIMKMIMMMMNVMILYCNVMMMMIIFSP